jgi:hypothetical protein
MDAKFTADDYLHYTFMLSVSAGCGLAFTISLFGAELHTPACYLKV